MSFTSTNQIMKPISQIFALCIEKIPTFKKSRLQFYHNLYNSLKDSGKSIDAIDKKILSEKQKEVEQLLFWDMLLICDSQKNGSQSISKWFN